jgi:predicted GNAT family acetyltransferase
MEVRDNAARSRYELADDERVVAVADYEPADGTISFVHTFVDPELRRRGLGEFLVRQALDDVRSRNLHVVPECPFVAAFIQRHPEYTDLVES